jgi:hypothetical protein
MSQAIKQPVKIEGDVNSDAVRQQLQKQTDIPTSPICPICWENLCGYDVEIGKDQIVVAWNGCG